MKKVYGDYLAEKLDSVVGELRSKEDDFILDTTGKLLVFDSDIENYINLRKELETLRGYLITDEIRGTTGINLFRERVVNGEYQDLFYRLVESGEFPNVWELYEYEQEVK